MCRARRSLLSIALAIASLAGTAGAQPAGQPEFRSGVHLVEVDVRVFDRTGQFVSGLGLESFELVEDNVPQSIHALYLVDGSRVAVAQAAHTPEARAIAIRAPARQTWVFVFDLDHLTPGTGFTRARDAVDAFIRTTFQEGDLGGVVAGTRMVNNRLTSVREELATAVKSITPRTDSRNRHIELTREWPRLQDESEALAIAREDTEALRRAVTRACSEAPERCHPVLPDLDIREKARRLQRDVEQATTQTLTAMHALASGLAKMPGPKTVVFLSDGFVTQQLDTTLRQVVGQAARAGARIYAIDARGLNRGRGASIIDQTQTDDPVGGPAEFDLSEDGANSLAVDSGGMMIRNENNIDRALETIADDANRYYVLAYQPANPAFDGTFRSIEVRVKRPDVRVRARRGYLALEPARMLIPEPIRTTTTTAPLPATAEEPPPAETANAPAVPAVGTLVGGPRADPAGAVRIRPGSTERIREIAGADLLTSDQLAHRGWDAYQRGDVETAVGLFAQAAIKPDVRPWVLYTLGLSHAALGHPSEAATSWERVRHSAPEFRSVYLDLADTYLQTGDLTTALAVLRDAEKRWQRDAEIQNAIGVIHVRRGALNDGIAAFSKAADAAPDDALTYWNMGRAFELRYIRGRRYVSSQRIWTANDEDRRKAMLNYRRCVDLGGPYRQEAEQALGRLEWTRK